MRNAKAELVIIEVTGERPEIERLMGSFGGGPLEKYRFWQLAGGLPYFMPRSGAAVDGAIRLPTVTVRDHGFWPCSTWSGCGRAPPYPAATTPKMGKKTSQPLDR